MKRKIFYLTISLVCFMLMAGGQALADSWSGHYDVTTTITNLGPNYYRFQYDVTNLDQGNGFPDGLDGFAVQVPLTAVILNTTNPPPYNAWGAWPNILTNTNLEWGSQATLQPGYQWLQWWGNDWGATYPVGSTATFSFEASNVLVTQNAATLVSFLWANEGYNGDHYLGFNDNISGPGAVPLPGSLLLLGSSLLGLAGWRRFRKS